MFNSERQKEILNIIQNKKSVTTKEIANYFNVSIDSIRRDFLQLEADGKIERAHGGAIIKEPSILMPPSGDVRFSKIDNEKIAIAKKAASLINENETIFLLGTSIQYAMIKYLSKTISLTIVTNSIIISNELKNFENITVIQIGGTIKPSGNSTDTIAQKFIEYFHFDKSFISCGGINDKYISTSTPEVALFTQKVINQSKQSILLVHHEKFNRTLFSKIIENEKIDKILLDKTFQSDFPLLVENSTKFITI